MKTIKERAIEKYCTHCGARVEYNCSAMETPCNSIKNYIEIATEQKKIDDANLDECVDEIIKANTDLRECMVKLTKQEMTQKAWQWVVDWVFENAPHEVFDELMSSREEYIKAMEE